MEHLMMRIATHLIKVSYLMMMNLIKRFRKKKKKLDDMHSISINKVQADFFMNDEEEFHDVLEEQGNQEVEIQGNQEV